MGDMGEIKLTVEGYEASRIEDSVVEKIASRIDDDIREELKSQIADLIKQRMGAIVVETVNTTVAAIFEEGWETTNNYGEKIGPKKTVKDRLSEILFAKPDSYSNSKRLLDQAMHDALQKALQADFAQVLADAKAKFKAMVDDEMTGRLQKTLKEALGLK